MLPKGGGGGGGAYVLPSLLPAPHSGKKVIQSSYSIPIISGQISGKP